MDEKNLKNDELEIDLSRLFGALIKRAWLIGVVAVLCAVLTLVGTVLFVAPKYESSTMFYVNNSSLSLGDMDVSISTGDISASKSLVKTYIVILTARETLNDVIDYAGVDRTYSEVKRMIQAEAVDSTEVFRVTVTSEDPVEAEQIADAIAYILPKRISKIIQGTTATVVDSAILPLGASSPNYTKNTMLGFVIGLVAIAAVLVVLELLDNTVRQEDDITQVSNHPILATVPDMAASGKGSVYGSKKNKAGEEAKQNAPLIGGEISFSALESYKLLRTKLQFSFADEDGCRVIGITSALSGEGKSLTSINLAYSLSELGKRVILIDADMRRPTLAKKLPIQKEPGLSSCLTGQRDLNNLLQNCGIPGNEKAFRVIAAGQNPPNPVELLSSNRMDVVIETLRKHYDYIIIDLPPVTEVSDVLAVANKLDGILLVVRQNVCNRVALNATVRQLAFVKAKVLGIVFNSIHDEPRGYLKKYYSRYYSRSYGSYYGNTYGQRSEESIQQED
jgi:capsular exopolysaccharide synthesis family protein